MPVIYQKLICREDLRKNPLVLYLYGDNCARTGRGGQAAEMRGEPNAVGIRTKNTPTRDTGAYWSDRNFEENCTKIEEDLVRVKAHLRCDGIVVIPSAGIGVGLSEMKNHCPKTFHVLQQMLCSLENKND